jgi:hypothetical protein
LRVELGKDGKIVLITSKQTNDRASDGKEGNEWDTV